MLVHPSSGACDLLWIYFMCCIALVRCVLVLRCGSVGWCGILMQAEAQLQPAYINILLFNLRTIKRHVHKIKIIKYLKELQHVSVYSGSTIRSQVLYKAP